MSKHSKVRGELEIVQVSTLYSKSRVSESVVSMFKVEMLLQKVYLGYRSFIMNVLVPRPL